MRSFNILLFEWKHFTKSPFKIIALLLFLIAAIYGLHNGKSLYVTQTTEISNIEGKANQQLQNYISQYEDEEVSKDRPKMGTPSWAMNHTETYNIKKPSPAMVYSIGQAEQYGFYKKIRPWASPYDADMAREIANPERLQIGSLDFNFVILFLFPLLFLILLYNLRSFEAEQGFLPLIEVQTISKNAWLLSRVVFYFILVGVILIALLFYGAMLTNVFETANADFGKMLFTTFLYLTFWSILYFFILNGGKSILGNTLKMVGIWLLFAFIIPATVHQYVSIVKPANLMTELIDANRDKVWEIYDEPETVIQPQLNQLYPEIVESPVFKDSTKRDETRRATTVALVNEFKKESIELIEQENAQKNRMISHSFWFNPVSFFQNRLNRIAQTHYDNYNQHREDVQRLTDKCLKKMVLDSWHDVKVDKQKYIEYNEMLSQIE